MRIFDAALLLASALLISGCGEQSGDFSVQADAIPCAIGEGAAMADGCSVERTTSTDGTLLTIRQPDGGFHRLRVTTDGRGVIAADGAQEAKVAVVGGGTIEVTIDDARYRLPATVKGGAAK